MGCCGSSFAAELEKRYPQSLAAIGVLDRIEWFANFFKKMDVDNDGSISLFEFLERCDLDLTPFIKRVFAVVDRDASKSLDFREWIFCVWHFSSMGKSELVGFLFDLYDVDGSGTVDRAELATALRESYGSKADDAVVRAVVKRINREPEGGMSRAKFVSLFKTMSQALFPAVSAQATLRTVIIGHRYWEAASRERAKHASALFRPKAFRRLFTKLVEDDLNVRARRANPKPGQVVPKC